MKVAQIKEVPHQVETLQNELKEAQKQNESLQAKIAAQQANNVFENVQATKNGSLIAAEVQVAGMGQLRQLADAWRSKALSDVLVLATASEGKANLLVAVSDDKTKEGLKAGDLIKAIAPAINGGGGGRPNLAQAGGKNPAGIKEALSRAKGYLDK